MDLQQCWASFLKAEQLLAQGHWPEAHHLFDDVLHHIPSHIQCAVENHDIKPCQFACLLSGLRDASVSQSEILNRMGQHQRAFDTLNQSYALLQFLSIEPIDIIQRSHRTLDQYSNDLLRHMGAFCTAQRSAQWMLEFEHVQKAHHYFSTLKQYNEVCAQAPVLN